MVIEPRAPVLVTVVASLLLAAAHAGAQTPCECPDMFDLINRQREAEAAIRAYEAKLAGWGDSAPRADEAGRDAFQKAEIQPFLNAVTSSKANKARGHTNIACQTDLNTAPTACLKEVIDNHESVHRNACRQYQVTRGDFLSIVQPDRWRTLADYSREEIESYRAELTYVNASLTNLERDCRFKLEFRSTIRGGAAVAESKAESDIDVAIELPRGLAPRPLKGTSTLQYDTRDVGPPKVVGPPKLVQLAPVCYATFEGRGNTAFDVVDGWIMRETTPPHGPLVELSVRVGETRETHKLKGGRGCPRGDMPGSFWSDLFLLAKPQPSPRTVVIDGWTFQPRSGVFAEKTIRSNCTAPGTQMPTVAGMQLQLCAETTTLTLKPR